MPSWKHAIWDRCEPTARSWPSIVDFYADLVRRDPVFEPIAELATRLARSPYVERGLAALTSHERLIIGPSNDILSNPNLRISWDFDRHEFHFEYDDGSKSPWQRTVSRVESFAALERFLTKRARWYPRVTDGAHSG